MSAYERYVGQGILTPIRVTDAGAGARARAGAIGEAVGVLDDVGRIAAQEAAKEAELAGKQAGIADAVQYDERGNLLPLTTLPPADTIYGAAYREAAITNYGLAALTQAENKADELARQNKLNPQGFLDNWNAYVKATLDQLHPDVAPMLKPSLMRLGGKTYGTIADETAKHEIEVAVGNIDQRVQDAYRDAEHIAGDLGFEPATVARSFQIVTTEILPLLEQKRKIDPSYTGSAMREDLRTYQLGLVSQAVMGEAWKVASSRTVTIQGVPHPDEDAAEKFLNDLVSDPPAELAAIASPEEIAAMTDRARTWVSLRTAETSTARARAQEQNAVAAQQAQNAWMEKIDNARPEDLPGLMRELGTATLSRDPVQNANMIGALMNTMRDRARKEAEKAAEDFNRAAETRFAGEWQFRIRATTDEKQLGDMLAEADQTKFSLDPVRDEQIRANLKLSIQNQQEQVAAAAQREAEQLEKERPALDLARSAAAGNGPLPDTELGRKAADKLYQSAVTQGTDLSPYTGEGRQNLVDWAKRYAVLPKSPARDADGATKLPITEDIARARYSGDPQQVAVLAETWRQMTAANPAIAGQVAAADDKFLRDIAEQMIGGAAATDAWRYAIDKLRKSDSIEGRSRLLRDAQAAIDTPEKRDELWKQGLDVIGASHSLLQKLYSGFREEQLPPGVRMVPGGADSDMISLIFDTPITNGAANLPEAEDWVKDKFAEHYARHLTAERDKNTAVQMAVADLSNTVGITSFTPTGKPDWTLYPVEQMTGMTPLQLQIKLADDLAAAMGEQDAVVGNETKIIGSFGDLVMAGVKPLYDELRTKLKAHPPTPGLVDLGIDLPDVFEKMRPADAIRLQIKDGMIWLEPDEAAFQNGGRGWIVRKRLPSGVVVTLNPDGKLWDPVAQDAVR